MDESSLDTLLQLILSPDNVQRAAAEKELERRGREEAEFSISLARYCKTLAESVSQRALALVALSALKRVLQLPLCADDLQRTVSTLATDFGDTATLLPCGAAALLRHWASVINVGVQRLAVMSVVATEADGASTCSLQYGAVSSLITSRILSTLVQHASTDSMKLSSVCSQVWLLRTFFDEPVPQAMYAWCEELVESCVPPLFEVLCSAVSKTRNATAAETATAVLQMRDASPTFLIPVVAQTLGVLFEWQFATTGRRHFPATLKQHFLTAYPLLEPLICTSCSQSLLISNSCTTLEGTPGHASNLVISSLATLDFVTSVLKLGGWYKRCVKPAILLTLLQTLEANLACFLTALQADADNVEDVATAAVWALWERNTASNGGTSSSDGAGAVRRHVTQLWAFFRDVAFLPHMKVALVDVVGQQCGLHYYRLLLSYAALAPADAGLWQSDPSTFLRDEEERQDGLRWTTRDIVAYLFVESMKLLGPLFLHASLEDLHEILLSWSGGDGGTCGKAQCVQPGDGAILLDPALQRREAALFFMELTLTHCSKQLRECGAADFTPLATRIWVEDVDCPTTHPALLSRALVLLSSIVEFTHKRRSRDGKTESSGDDAPADALLATVVAGCVEKLSILTGTAVETSSTNARPVPAYSPLVAVLLCRVLQTTLPFWPPALLARYLAPWQISLLALLSPQSGLAEEALYSTIDQLSDLLETARREQKNNGVLFCSSDPREPHGPYVSFHLPQVVMKCWRYHVNDPSFADCVLRLLRCAACDRRASELLLEELPWINKILSGYADSMAEVCAVPYFLRLIRYLFIHVSDDVMNRTASLMLDNLCQLLLCTDESAILGASGSCLAALLRRCSSAQVVQVHVVASTVEAAMAGGTAPVDSDPDFTTAALVAEVQRVAFPFSTVLIAIVLRMLDDHRAEASLLDMGNTLSTIMSHSTSFSAAQLTQVIHATVHRLTVVCTDTVSQELLAPLATLLLLHPVELLHTLVQSGLLSEIMSLWLPRVEHFSSFNTVLTSCEGLLALLACLRGSPLSITAEEGHQLAQQPVSCQWRLPEELASSGRNSRSEAGRNGRKGASTGNRKSPLSVLKRGAPVTTLLPLFAAVLVGVGRGFLTLLSAPLTSLKRVVEHRSCNTIHCSVGDSEDDDSTSDEEHEQVLFREDEESDEEGGSLDDVGDFPDDDQLQNGAAYTKTLDDTVERLPLLATISTQLQPWMQAHSDEMAPYFTALEVQTLLSFFASCSPNAENLPPY